MKTLVIYRCCDAELQPSQFKHVRPSWFNKLKCFKSVWDECNAGNPFLTDLIVVHDGAKRELYEYISKKTNKIHKINYNSNNLSLYETFDIADKYFNREPGGNPEYDVIHFIEDDFLVRPKFLHAMYYGTKAFGLTTGFDHLDRYKRTDDATLGKEYVAFSMSTYCHWRTVESTTCTWSCTRDMWKNISPTVRKHGLQDRELFRDLYSQGIRLWSPIPGYSTTLDVNTLSPGIDWITVNHAVQL